MKLPTHRAEHSGDASLDRIQGNVRALEAAVRQFMSRTARQHGLGMKRIVLRDQNYTLSLEEAAAAFLVFEGTLTAGRTIFVPRASDADAYARWMNNATTGAYTLTIANVDGSASLLGGTHGFIVVGEDGPEAWV